MSRNELIFSPGSVENVPITLDGVGVMEYTGKEGTLGVKRRREYQGWRNAGYSWISATKATLLRPGIPLPRRRTGRSSGPASECSLLRSMGRKLCLPVPASRHYLSLP